MSKLISQNSYRSGHSSIAISVMGNSSLLLPLQRLLANSYIAMLGRCLQLSSHYSPLQPTLTTLFWPDWFLRSPRITAHSYIAFLATGVIPQHSSHCSPHLHRNFGPGIFPQMFSHCGSLQPTIASQFSRGCSSESALPLQRNAAHLYNAVLAGGGGGLIQQNCSHCSPLLYRNFDQGFNSQFWVIPICSYIILLPSTTPDKETYPFTLSSIYVL